MTPKDKQFKLNYEVKVQTTKRFKFIVWLNKTLPIILGSKLIATTVMSYFANDYKRVARVKIGESYVKSN